MSSSQLSTASHVGGPSSRPEATATPAPLLNPVEPTPTQALFDSYTYHSVLPAHEGIQAGKTEEEGAADDADTREPWMMGIDEAGRGRESALIDRGVVLLIPLLTMTAVLGELGRGRRKEASS